MTADFFPSSRPVRVLTMLLLSSCASSAPRAPVGSRDTGASSLATPFTRVRAPDDLAVLEAPARALPDATSVERVSASYALRVVEVHVAAGDEVAVGAPIVTVSSASVLSAAAEHEGARRQLEIERARLAELRALRGNGYVTSERVFELERQERVLEGTLRIASATLRAAEVSPASAARTLSHGVLTLHAHVAGIVRELRVVRGDVLTEGGTFATIVSHRSRRIEARFAKTPPPVAHFAFEDLMGRRTSLGSPLRIADGSDQGGVIAWFDTPEGVDIEPYAEGHVHVTLTAPGHVQVPATAIVSREGVSSVLRRRARRESRVSVVVVMASGAAAIVRGDLRVTDDVAADGDAALPAGRVAP